MEKRALLAIALSVGILLAWQVWFTPAPPKPEPGPGPAAGAPTAGSATPGPGALPAPATTAGPPSAPGGGSWVPEPSGGDVGPGATVETPLYRIEFGADGTVLSWMLRYRGGKPLVVGVGGLAVGLKPASGVGVQLIPVKPERSAVAVGPATGPVGLDFVGTTPQGVQIRKRLEFRPDSFEVGVRVQVSGGAASGSRAVLYWTSPVSVGGAKAGDPRVTFGETPDHKQLLGRILVDRRGQDPLALEAPAPVLKDARDAAGGAELKEPNLVTLESGGGEAAWVALENDYFVAALVPSGGRDVLRGRDRSQAVAGVIFDAVSGSGVWEGTTRLYVGPKEWERLAALGVGLEGAQARNYGHFLGTWEAYHIWTPPMWWFCVPLLWLLNFFGTHVPGQNYGVAIILLTVLVKGVFYPLAQKSMRSMKRMQALQPQLNALKSKHRADPQRYQREQMELFRKHGVNPMGGCLPMVVQIPIFYALYLTLQYSVELQGAPFLLWIHDLSKKDSYYVLPILMGASMLLQQKMTPTVGDPRQARVMLIMPVVFTFMFLEFPTGLVLYWLVNNVLSVAQQYLIDRAVAAGNAAEGRIERDARRA